LLFPPSLDGLATVASVEREFPAALAEADAFGRISGVPAALPRAATDDALRRAPRGTAPGPSGLRMEHLRALGDSGQVALAAVVRLLAGPVSARRVPPLAAHALAGADLLLLCKPGGDDDDGLPRLRPIGMPEVLCKLAAAALAGTVRDAAARLLAPLQRGVWVPNPCERVVHDVTAELAHDPTAALLQLDFRNAFNLVSRAAAVAYLARALPLLRPYLDRVYLGAAAPRVYGWAVADDVVSGGAAALTRLWLPVERGVQQGDPLGPLMHAAAMHLAVLRLATAHPGAVVRAVHDDVVVVAPHSELRAVLRTAAEAGAAVDAELAPSKCAGWSPAGADAPVGWPARWCAEGVHQFSVPLGTDAFLAASVDRLAADQSRLVAAINALTPAELQSQLLLLRLCAGPRPNYWLRALPLARGTRLAAAVDRTAQGALRQLLTDARDDEAVVADLLDRASLPVAHGGLGIGGRTAVVPAASLASQLDTLRAGRHYSRTLAAVADGLVAVTGTAAGEPLAWPPAPSGGFLDDPGAPAHAQGRAGVGPQVAAAAQAQPRPLGRAPA